MLKPIDCDFFSITGCNRGATCNFYHSLLKLHQVNPTFQEEAALSTVTEVSGPTHSTLSYRSPPDNRIEAMRQFECLTYMENVPLISFLDNSRRYESVGIRYINRGGTTGRGQLEY